MTTVPVQESQHPITSLETFRQVIGYNPYHFWGLANAAVPVNSACNDTVVKHSWQAADAGGRDDIENALKTAETKLRDFLKYSPVPHYVTETLSFPRYFNRQLSNYSNTGSDGRWESVQLIEGKTIAIGAETIDLIETSAVTISDANGDTVNDTFVATTVATTTETDPNNLSVYFNSTDRYDGSSQSDEWEIKPVRITINTNGTISLRGPSWLLVKPILYEGVGAHNADIDPNDATKFATTLDICRHYAAPAGITVDTSQAVLTWETFPFPNMAACCGGSAGAFNPNGSSDPAASASAVARAGIRDATIGLIIPAQAAYDSTTGLWNSMQWSVCKPPDRITVRYKAGMPLVNFETHPKWKQIIVHMAAAEMSRAIHSCEKANRELYRWQFDHARAQGANDEQYSISQEDLNNPFGTRAGHVEAWKMVKEFAHGKAFVF